MEQWILYFFIYGFIGWCCEVGFSAFHAHEFVNRGFLKGPICPIYGFGVVGVVLSMRGAGDNLLVAFLSAAMLTTLLELVTGFLMEKLFHRRWWDYSDKPLNIGGYVCLPVSLFWGAACVVVLKVVHPMISGAVSLLPMPARMALACLFALALVLDLISTLVGVSRMNRQLERLQKAGESLRAVSDKIGKGIYEQVISATDKGHELSARLKIDSSDIKGAMEENLDKLLALRKEYMDALSGAARGLRRYVRAFPSMRERRYPEPVERIRRYWREMRTKNKQK